MVIGLLVCSGCDLLEVEFDSTSTSQRSISILLREKLFFLFISQSYTLFNAVMTISSLANSIALG